MLKKISAVVFAGSLALSMAACKKDDKGGGAGGGCDGLRAKMMEQAKAEMGEMKDAPPEAKKQMEEMAKKMGDVVVASCKEDKWPKEAIDCALKAKDPEKECDDKLSADLKKKMQDRAMKAMGDVMGGGGGAMPKPDEDKGGGGDTAGGGGGGSGLEDCDAYVAAVEKFMACDKVPDAARDGAKQGLEAMKSGWGDTAAMPDEAKKAANDACKQAIDALKQGASAMGCEM